MDTVHRRLFAFAAVAIMLAVPMTFITFSDDEDDSDANPLVRVGVSALKWGIKNQKEIRHWINTVAVVLVGIEIIKEITENDPALDEDTIRSAEASMLASMMTTGTAQYANAVSNYANIWGLTSEHWIRQAELTSASYWTADGQYSVYNAMSGSQLWYNSAILMENAVSQMNEQFRTVAEHVADWNGSEVVSCYGNGKMEMRFSLGTSLVLVTSDDDLIVRMCTVIEDSQKGGLAYYAGGPLYVSQDCRATSVQGHELNLKKGWNDNLPGADESEIYDVYDFPAGVTVCGTLLPVNMGGAAPVKAGMYVSGGNDEMIVTSYNGIVENGKGEQGRLKYSIVPQNVDDTKEADITQMILNYADLLKEVNVVMQDANQAAKVVWNIYDEHGSVSAYLTTLTVPETYKNVVLTDEQKQLVTTLAMDRFAEWCNESPTGVHRFAMTQDSLSLYCRGTITVKGTSGSPGGTENQVYENAIFTPIFYTDHTIRTGTNTYSQRDNGFVVVWGTGTSLSSFDMASSDYSDLLWIGNGATLQIAEMRYSGENVSSVDLDATNVEYIAPIEMKEWEPIPPPPENDNDMEDLVRIILIVLGIIALLYGARGGPIRASVMGLVLILMAVFAADDIAELLERYLDLKFTWPEVKL